MAFGYLRDPLFLVAFAIYGINRWILEPVIAARFLHAYVNDCICIPLFVPILVWGMRKLGLRTHDAPPGPIEIFVPLMLWAFVFEVALPRHPAFAGLAFADPVDVLCYCAGASVAVCCWQLRYRSGGSALSGLRAPRRPS